MAPGGSACKEVESYPAVADYAIATTKPESNSMTTKSSFGFVGKHGIQSNNGVYELLECPVCKNLMYPPIHQCPNGHTLCLNCKNRVHNCCPSCQYDLGNIRCLALERFAESLELPCDIPTLIAHLKDDHKVDMHDGCTFNHRYVKLNPHEVENATWMLTVSSFMLPCITIIVTVLQKSSSSY
uniref:RING-type domain-containing protein n=1 Tax=Gossypium raimondii TaxID=29730 RepID=A0A0D2Q762_GOSRA|nr:hypothetical protein B456_002G155600 [Gossypium raimondii]